MGSGPQMSNLPRLASITKLTPYVTRVLGQNAGPFCLQGTNTYLIGAPGTRDRILVDTGEGVPEYPPVLAQALEQDSARIVAIVITHWHRDHVGGIPSVRAHLGLDPELPVYKFRDERDEEDYAPVTDGQTISHAGVSLTAFHTPGHAEDHLVLWLEDEDVLFSADNVLGHGTSSYADYQQYLDSLRRMKALPRLARIFPGHGEFIEDGPAKIQQYIDHRLAREKQVLDVVQAKGPVDLPGIVATIYPDVPDSVLVAAERGVDQFLEKLASDGLVTAQDGKFRANL